MQKKPNILIFKFSSVLGGGERYSLILARELLKRGWDVLVLTNFKPFLRLLKKENVRVKKLYWGQEAGAIRNVFWLFLFYPIYFARFFLVLFFHRSKDRENIVLFQNLNEKIIASSMAKKMGYKVFWVDHVSIDPWLTKSILKSKYLKNLIYTDSVIVVSDTIKNEMMEKLKMDGKKIKVVHNGIDTEVFYPEDKKVVEAKKKEFGFYKGAKIIGTVGRLHKEKGIGTLIQAFAELVRRFDSISLLIVGDGPERRELEELTKKLGLEKKVLFLGFRDDVSILINMLDVFVLPSLLREACSLSILESLAAGKVVVASSIGGNPELVRSGVNGFLFKPGDYKDLAEKISKALSDDKTREVMEANALKIIKKEFSKEIMVDQLEKIFLS